MGAGASSGGLPTTIQDALTAGYTQEQIDEHLKSIKASPAEDAPAGASLPQGSVHAAFVFIKPHAAEAEAVEALVEERLAASGVTVKAKGVLGAAEIDEKLLIDVHYGAITKRAVLQEPRELNVPVSAQEKFEAAFGLSWEAALEQGLVYNAKGASERLGCDAAGLEVEWRSASKASKLVKFGGGFYCCSLAGGGEDGGGVDGSGSGGGGGGGGASTFYCINGFYLNMREEFTKPPARIKWFSVEFPATLRWADFRGKVLGATNPETAAEGSIRKAIFDGWEELGLSCEPNTGLNGVHASASPLEGLFERMNWLHADPASDSFGSVLMSSTGLPEGTLKLWAGDPAVSFLNADGQGTSLQSLFDLHEDLDCAACIARSVEVMAANL